MSNEPKEKPKGGTPPAEEEGRADTENADTPAGDGPGGGVAPDPQDGPGGGVVPDPKGGGSK